MSRRYQDRYTPPPPEPPKWRILGVRRNEAGKLEDYVKADDLTSSEADAFLRRRSTDGEL